MCSFTLPDIFLMFFPVTCGGFLESAHCGVRIGRLYLRVSNEVTRFDI